MAMHGGLWNIQEETFIFINTSMHMKYSALKCCEPPKVSIVQSHKNEPSIKSNWVFLKSLANKARFTHPRCAQMDSHIKGHFQ